MIEDRTTAKAKYADWFDPRECDTCDCLITIGELGVGCNNTSCYRHKTCPKNLNKNDS